MHQAACLQVSKIRISDTLSSESLLSSPADSKWQATVCIGLLVKDHQLKDDLITQLKKLIRMIPVVEISEDAADKTTHVAVPSQDVFLVTDWSKGALDERYPVQHFASMMLLGQEGGVVTAPEDGVFVLSERAYDHLEENEVDRLCEEIVLEVQSRLFPSFEERRLALHAQNQQQHEFLDHIGRELSVFYHNINNPLTVLSGNIQLLQLLAESMHISADLMKPISDIATVSGRFEQDLKSIAELKEKIRAEGLQKEPSKADTL